MSEHDQPMPGQTEHAQKARMYGLLAEHEEAHAEGGRLPQETHRELHDLLAQHPILDPSTGTFGMAYAGRIPLNDAEHDAIDRLVAKHHGESVSLTRRDPGESGPVLVHISDDIYLVNDSGRATKQKAAA